VASVGCDKIKTYPSNPLTQNIYKILKKVYGDLTSIFPLYMAVKYNENDGEVRVWPF